MSKPFGYSQDPGHQEIRHWYIKIIIETKIQCQHIVRHDLSKCVICSTCFHFSQQDSQEKFNMYLLLSIISLPRHFLP